MSRTDAAGVAETYSYDAAGNLISRIPEAVADAAGADAGPGLGLLGQSGNIAGADPLEGLDLSSAVYGYNGKNQMILAETDGGKTENVFNAEGLRIAKIARQSDKIRLEEML